jgi:hypothetical protein
VTRNEAEVGSVSEVETDKAVVVRVGIDIGDRDHAQGSEGGGGPHPDLEEDDLHGSHQPKKNPLLSPI